MINLLLMQILRIFVLTLTHQPNLAKTVRLLLIKKYQKHKPIGRLLNLTHHMS